MTAVEHRNVDDRGRPLADGRILRPVAELFFNRVLTHVPVNALRIGFRPFCGFLGADLGDQTTCSPARSTWRRRT